MMWPPCTNTLPALNQLSRYIQKFHKREIESSSAITLCPLSQLTHTRITACNVYRFYILPAYKGDTKKIEVDKREKKEIIYRELVETFSLLYFKSFFELYSRHIFFCFFERAYSSI
jgi:hypothetical protein